MNGIRPRDSMNFAAGLTSLQGSDGNRAESRLPALGALPHTSPTGDSFE